MRLLLDARNITDKPAGVARYAKALIPELARLMPDDELCVIRHASNQTPLDVPGIKEVFVDVPIDNTRNVLFGHKALGEAFRKFGPPDIYHNLFHVSPRRLPDSLKVVVTLHDLVWIEHPDASQPTWLKARAIEQFAKRAIPATLQRADHVISVSDFTAERARRYHSSPTTVIMHGVETHFFDPVPPVDPIVEHLTRDQTRYIVAVGNSKPYKNLHRLICAWARARPKLGKSKLCLVGDNKALMPLIEELGLKDDVVLVGFLGDEDLRRIVGHAHLFAFPSLVEGFGLPPLEAMALGVPVILSNIEPMKTVGGEAALSFDPLDIEAMAQAIESVFNDDTLHQNMIRKGKAHAAAMTWTRAAEETLKVYQTIG